jgi:flagellar motor switch protein FliN
MDGMLSQDEINALLQGMDLSDTADSGASPETPQDSSSAENTDNAYVKDVAPTVGDEEELTDVEKDAIGEVANISMGSSATTLYSLVNRKVNITTPVVSVSTVSGVSSTSSIRSGFTNTLIPLIFVTSIILPCPIHCLRN